jgi:hypothetical protein
MNFHLSLRVIFAITWLICCAFGVRAQSVVAEASNFNPTPIIPVSRSIIDESRPPLTSESIIKSFIEAETKFRGTLSQFSFKRHVVLQTIGKRGEITGEYIRNSVFVLDDRGQVIERVTEHPKPTIKELKITKEDIQDLAGSQLFGLTELNSYKLEYLSPEMLDGHVVQAIAVSPKEQPDPHNMRARYFIGTVWLDGVTLQPVKLRGITEPHGKQRFATFETTRGIELENLFFPSSTFADDVLRFPHQSVHYRITVRYYDFRRFASRVNIIELDDPVSPNSPN